MKEGIFKLTETEYRTADGVNQSGLSVFHRSPKHYKWYLENPTKDTKAKTDGVMIHNYLLEHDTFFSHYGCLPAQSEYPYALVDSEDYKKKAKSLGLKVSGTKAELKEAILSRDNSVVFWDDILAKASSTDRAMITPNDLGMLESIKKSVNSHKIAHKLLASGDNEQSLFWQDPDTGLTCKARPDVYNNDFIVDLKSADDGSYHAFQKKIADLRYHVQAAFYLDGLSLITKKQYTTFVFVVVEKSAPFGVGVYVADNKMIEKGRSVYKKDMSYLADCMRENRWPDYTETTLDISLPRWAL